jgi:Flp pilus assembly protein TadD
MTAEVEGGDLQAQLAQAVHLSEDGQHTQAFELLMLLEREHPEAPELLCALGALASHLGADGMAGDFFRRCLAQEPTDPHLLVTAGAGLSRAGDPAAESALRMAALTSPNLVTARTQYGAHLIRSGMLEQGMDELNAAKDLAPDDVVTRRELGVAHLIAGRQQLALEQLELATAADEDEHEVKMLFALALLQAGDLARAAEEMYPLGIPLADDGDVQIILALVFALQGWEEEAWVALSRAEASEQRIDPVVLREVEEALEVGEEAINPLLFDELVPSALRDRLFQEF